MENLKETLEAIIFGAGAAIKRSDIMEKMPQVSKKTFEAALLQLKEQYSGKSGIHMLFVGDKVQFSSNPAYGEIAADVLRPVREKALSKSLLETLALVAYKQPITKPEIDEIRAVQSSDYQISMLVRADLIQPVGRKDSVGRPVLYGTTDEFLKKFELENITQLPDYTEIMARLKSGKISLFTGDNLYRDVNVVSEDETEAAVAAALLEELTGFDNPDFLGEDFEVVEAD